MRIEKITIENFRGFKDKSFEFDPKVNVILGDNTSGKTTLLHAIQIALGAVLQEMTFLPGGNGYSRNFRPSDHVMVYSESSKSFLPIDKNPSIEVHAECIIKGYNEFDHVFAKKDFKEDDKIITKIDYKEDYNLISKINLKGYDSITSKKINYSPWKRIQWKRTSNRNSSANVSQLRNFVREILENRRRSADEHGENSIFPLFLSFGATRLEKNYKGAEKTKKRETREARAYKCALDEQVDFKSAFDWIYRYDISFAKGDEFAGTDTAFLNAIKEAIPAISQIDIDRKHNEFSAQIKMADDNEPNWLTYDMMSAGFNAMINIAAEIAHRCIELNGFLGIDAVKHTPGIIMIDEVDLYLHPHWQQHVLADLQNAFPMMQFIVTTHSPFIVQSMKSNNIITLDGVKGGNNPDMRSIEDIAVTEMNMDTARSPRYNLMVEKAEKYYRLVQSGMENTEECKSVKKELDEIEEQFSDDPAYVALLRTERKSQ